MYGRMTPSISLSVPPSGSDFRSQTTPLQPFGKGREIGEELPVGEADGADCLHRGPIDFAVKWVWRASGCAVSAGRR